MPAPARLRGAWSLTGAPVDKLLPEKRRAGGELKNARLWLAAAHDGILSPGPGELDAPRNGGAAGHFVSSVVSKDHLSLVRDPTGGERLYFRRDGDLLLFASSLKALLALSGRSATLDSELAFERGVAELACFGDRTLAEGVSEVLPGRRVVIGSEVGAQENLWPDLLAPVEGDLASLAVKCRAALKEAVARCIGKDGRAAVALSGGVDSVAVAALAVELVGPDKVTAFTSEYQDPGHPSEVPDAVEACRRLGIKTHKIVPISFDDFAAAAPAGVWLAEDPGYWKRSYPQALAKAAAAEGFDKFLTGFGVGSHMGWLADCASVVPSLPAREWTLRYWSQPKGALSAALARLHPGLEAPMHRLLYPTLAVLRSRGLLSDARGFYPAALGGRVEQAFASARVREEIDSLSKLPLGRQMQNLAFDHMNSCADVARCERPARESGAMWLGPAHFPEALPYFYLPPKLALPAGDPRRKLRPGKLLLREAMKDILPEGLASRRKDWAQTIGSRAWRDRVLAKMDAAAGPSWEALRAVFGDALEPAKARCPEGMIPLAFWHRIFIDGSFEKPPTWQDLA